MCMCNILAALQMDVAASVNVGYEAVKISLTKAFLEQILSIVMSLVLLYNLFPYKFLARLET